jgi:hypothetical protein
MALPGAKNVDQALAGHAVEEHTVTVRMLNEAFAIADLTDKRVLKLGHFHAAGDCQSFDFVLSHPDVARLSCAAATATGNALKP